MNGSYYQTPVFINDVDRDTTFDKNYNMEQSYIENILRNNIGKKVRVHASFSDSVEWRDRVFVGIIERAGRDNLIINDIDNGRYYLILMIYVDFVEFNEKITYAK
jgi:spore germination protein Q